MNNESKSVPLIIYESEMKHKTNIIKGLLAIIFVLIVVFGAIISMFISFINAHDIVGYDQNGDGLNNINSGSQGDVINESTIETDD